MDRRNRIVSVMVALSLLWLAIWPLAPVAAINGVVTADIWPDCRGGRVTINGAGLHEVLIKVDGATVLTLNLGPGSFPFTWPDAVLADICNPHQATLVIGSLVRGPEPFGGDACCALKPVVFQQGLEGYIGATDTYLNKWIPSKNYGNDGYIRTHTSGEQVGLLRFDLSSLPANATIISATLSLYLEMGFGRVGRVGDEEGGLDAPINATEVPDFSLPIPLFHPGTLEIYRMLTGWNALQASWNQAASGDPWEQAGAYGPLDREQEPAAIADITFPQIPVFTGPELEQPAVKGNLPVIIALGIRKWITAPVVPLVQGWVANPASNQGVWLLARSDVGVAYPFLSSNNWDKFFRPKLMVIYSVPQ